MQIDPHLSRCRSLRCPVAMGLAAARRFPVLMLALVAIGTGEALGEVVTDGTLGPARVLGGPSFVVDESLGTRAGANLFHSFQRFSILAGESARFTGAAEIENVISRVTGGEPTQIDGLLQSEIGGADFYFLNPKGVLFGQGAVLDVPAAFHIATADALHFEGGERFQAAPEGGGGLALGAPESFGFLQQNRATLRMEGSELLLEGSSFTASAHQIALDDAVIQAPSSAVRLRADTESGGLTLVNTLIESGGDGGGEIVLSGSDLVLQGSEISNFNTGAAEAHTATHLEGGRLSMEASTVTTWTGGEGAGSQIRVTASGEVLLTQGARLESRGLGEGAAGDLVIHSDSLRIGDSGSGIGSYQLTGAGRGGDVTIVTSGAIQLGNGTEINSDTYAEGPAGDVVLQAGSLEVGEIGTEMAQASITSDAVRGSGAAGSVQIRIEGATTIRHGGYISSDVYSAGDAGLVEVESGTLTLDGRGSDLYTGISSDALEGTGSAGEVRVSVVGDLHVMDAAISSDSHTDGASGAVQVSAGRLALTAESQAYISSDTLSGLGDAGTVLVQADEILIGDNAYISSDTGGSGDAGLISIEAQRLTMNGGTGHATISSDAMEGSTGDGGLIYLQVPGAIEMRNDAYISGDTYGSGAGGDILIETGALTMDGAGYATGISTGTYLQSDATAGNGGAILLRVDGELRMQNSSWITSDTEGSGEAGWIDLRAGGLHVEGGSDDSGVTSKSFGDGPGGLVTLIVEGGIALSNGGQISTTGEGEGKAGSVLIEAAQLQMEGGEFDSRITSNALGALGEGGWIKINLTGDLVLGHLGTISSSTEGAGDAGYVEIAAANLLLAPEGGEAYILSDTQGTGAAGLLEITTPGLLQIGPGAYIASDTHAAGEGGWVKILAGDLLVQGRSDAFTGISADSLGGSGDAGSIELRVERDAVLESSAFISSDTLGAGRAGNIDMEAGRVYVDGGDDFAGLSSESNGGSGDAGWIDLRVTDSLHLYHNAIITTSTTTPGNAGYIWITAPSVQIDGAGDPEGMTAIASVAYGAEGVIAGEVGSILLVADRVVLEGGGQLSIASIGETSTALQGQSIEIEAGQILLQNQASVSAAAEGSTPAANVVIVAARDIRLNGGSAITTASEQADAGSVTLQGGMLVVRESLVTTSVSGDQGDGGDILLRGEGLILDQGFIQANTAAANASGGDIEVTTPFLLVPSSQQLVAGGNQRMVYRPDGGVSVIQAAAPDGISGDVTLDVPEVDLAATVFSVEAGFLPLSPIGENPCQLKGGDIPSSLTVSGRGSLPGDETGQRERPLSDTHRKHEESGE